jgi:hypothetical protein
VEDPKKKHKSRLNVRDENLTLKDICNDYQKVKTILRPWTDAATGEWNDFKKSYKALAAAIVKDLDNKKHYKKEYRQTDKRIMCIVKNSFKFKIGIDTVKKSKPENFPSYLASIPNATRSTGKSH